MSILEIVLLIIGPLLVSILVSYILFLKNKCEKQKVSLETMTSKFDELEETVKKEMDEWKEEIEKEKEEQIRIQVQAMESNYDEALKEEMENLDKEIKKIDEKLGEKMKETLSKNTLFFTCVCDRNREIPCTMDLSSDENKFRCDRCGAEYRVEFSAYPILLSNVSSNQTLASLYDK